MVRKSMFFVKPPKEIGTSRRRPIQVVLAPLASVMVFRVVFGTRLRNEVRSAEIRLRKAPVSRKTRALVP